jgi:hypothetical protein
MATTIPSTILVPVAPVFTNTERLALTGFLAGYSGLTRQAYELGIKGLTRSAPTMLLRFCRLPSAATSASDLRRIRPNCRTIPSLLNHPQS